MPDLTVIEGGRRERKFREARHARALWNAIYPRPANGYDQIAERMRVSLNVVNNTIYHVRCHAEDYGWTIPHTKKGYDREGRSIFPVMIEGDSPALRRARAKEYLKNGAQSSCLTIASMGDHEATALDAAANDSGFTPSQRRRLRAAAGMFTAASQMAREVLSQIVGVA